MQARAYAMRGEQYLLIKSPPASGKSRALMFIALDKLHNQGLRQAIIIVPGLIFGISLWWLYFLTLFTSATLVWASYRKVLPTLIGFNTIWIFISIMVIAQNLVK
jgi:hypothetical protein